MKQYSAPGKLLLFGEHSAVYGYPALGMALHKYVHVGALPSKQWSMYIHPHHNGTGRAYNTQAHTQEKTKPVLDTSAFLLHLQTVIGTACTPMEFHIHSALPLGCGVGSSAALCTALASALHDCPLHTTHEHMQLAKLYNTAHNLEKFFHGTPSGIDTSLSVYRGAQALYFEGKNTLPRHEFIHLPPAYLVAASIPRTIPTKNLIQAVQEKLRLSPTATKTVLRNLGNITADAIHKTTTASALGKLAAKAQENLYKLGVSSPRMEELLAVGKDAEGGKLSGAGGGGTFFFVCKNKEQAKHVQTVLQNTLLPAEAQLLCIISTQEHSVPA